MPFTHQTPSKEKLKALIKKYRFIQIEKKLNGFTSLDHVLQTPLYQNLLIKNKVNVLKEMNATFSHKFYLPINEFPKINFTGLILGVNGDTLRQIEQETRSRIFIKGLGKDQSAVPVHCHINSDDTNALKKAIDILNGIVEEAIFANKTPQNVEEDLKKNEHLKKKFNDWEKFYLWWYYHNQVDKI